MKHPLSVIIITKDPKTQQETHNRFDLQTSTPRLSLAMVFLKAILGGKL